MKGPIKSNVLIFVCVVALISSLSIPVFLIFFKPTANTESKEDKQLTENLYEIFDGVYSKEEIDKMSTKEKEDLLKAPNQKDTPISEDKKDNKGKEDIQESDMDDFYKKIVKYSEVADFTTVMDKIKEFKDEYNLDYNSKSKLDNIEYDVTSIVATLTVDETQKGKIIKNLKNPELLLIGTLLSPEKSRRDVITDNLSLSPIFDGRITILNTNKVPSSDTSDEKVAYISSTNDVIESIYIIDFQVENYTLKAYIAETSADTLEFYGIYTPEGETNYFQTIEFWKNID